MLQKLNEAIIDLTPTPEHEAVMRQFERAPVSVATSHRLKDETTNAQLDYSIRHYKNQPYPQIIEIARLYVPKEHRGKGGAERLAAEFHQKVDKYQIPTVTYAAPMSRYETPRGASKEKSQQALMRGYGSHGYKKVGGSGDMVRLPKKPEG